MLQCDYLTRRSCSTVGDLSRLRYQQRLRPERARTRERERVGWGPTRIE
jgi:hypothetical protein